jgi:hypothetical protein
LEYNIINEYGSVSKIIIKRGSNRLYAMMKDLSVKKKYYVIPLIDNWASEEEG